MKKLSFTRRNVYAYVQKIIDEELACVSYLPDDYLLYVFTSVSNKILSRLEVDFEEDKVKQMVLDSIISKMGGNY